MKFTTISTPVHIRIHEFAKTGKMYCLRKKFGREAKGVSID
jgi:hypothetical protein